MPSTEQLERLRNMILSPLPSLIGESNSEFVIFQNILLERFEYVMGEARRNDVEIRAAGENPNRFFIDMVEKINNIKDAIFENTDDGTLYKPASFLLIDDGSIEYKFIEYLYQIIEKSHELFNSYLPSINNKSERYTAKSSFISKSIIAPHNACLELKKHGFISNSTQIKDFVAIFSGKEISSPIEWTGKISYLVYFIRKLEALEYIYDLGEDKWLVTQKCFIIQDGKPFTVKRLRHAYRVTKTGTIEKIIDLYSK